jgi:anti-sigma B factor antagonist
MHASSPPTPAFGLVVERHDTAVVIVLAGELDLFTAPEVRQRLVHEASAGAPRIVVDLERCTFVDSAGSAAILTAGRRCRTLGCELVVAAPNAPVTRLFEVLGLGDLMRVAPTRAEALAAVAD